MIKLNLKLFVRRNNKKFDWRYTTCWDGCCTYRTAPYHLKLIIRDPDHNLEIEHPLKGYKGAPQMRAKYVPYFDKLLEDCFNSLPIDEWVDITQRVGQRVLTQLGRDMTYCKSLPRNKEVKLLPFM